MTRFLSWIQVITTWFPNLLFWIQNIAMWIYVFFQSTQVFSGQTKGLTLATWVMFLAYLGFSLILAIASYREKPSTERKRVIKIFVQFTAIFLWLFIIGLQHIRWTNGDTVIVIIVGLLCGLTIYKYKGYKDHIARGQIAMWCKGVTQLWMAYVIYAAQSSEGMPPVVLLMSHITSFPRLVQVCLSGYKDGWDRPTRGLLIGELANVVSWAVVTVMWFIMR